MFHQNVGGLLQKTDSVMTQKIVLLKTCKNLICLKHNKQKNYLSMKQGKHILKKKERELLALWLLEE